MQAQILKRVSDVPILCSPHQTTVNYAMLISRNYFLNCVSVTMDYQRHSSVMNYFMNNLEHDSGQL